MMCQPKLQLLGGLGTPRIDCRGIRGIDRFGSIEAASAIRDRAMLYMLVAWTGYRYQPYDERPKPPFLRTATTLLIKVADQDHSYLYQQSEAAEQNGSSDAF